MTTRAIDDIPGETRAPASLPPTTTAEQNMKSAGQRRVNIIWEVTQSVIALAVVGVSLYTNCIHALYMPVVGGSQSPGLMQLNVLAALVTGFYFGRTNHARTGGVGGDWVKGDR